MLEIRDARKRFGALRALDGVSVDVPAGTVCCLVGPSGSGKSTLLRCVNALERLDSGYVRVDGEYIGCRPAERGRWREPSPRALRAQRAGIGMVFQDFRLFPHLTVLENLVEGPLAGRRADRRANRRADRGAAVAKAMSLLDRMGLADRSGERPVRLSGGQQQRVAIARALLMDPKMMLFDEPTSALDPELKGEVLAMVRELAEDGMTMLIVTHELAFAAEVADQVLVMDGGAVIEAGPPGTVLRNPSQARTEEFLERIL